MAVDIKQLTAGMNAVIANANANIQPGKTARSQDVRDALVTIATWMKKLAEAEFAAH